MAFDLQTIFEAVASCRAALALYPTAPKVIIAHYNASEALSALILGFRFPDSEELAFEQVLQMTKEKVTSATSKQSLAFFLGSAYEYGVGTKTNLSAAMKWYAVGAEAGDPVSKRELTRLQSAGLNSLAPEPAPKQSAAPPKGMPTLIIDGVPIKIGDTYEAVKETYGTEQKPEPSSSAASPGATALRLRTKGSHSFSTGRGKYTPSVWMIRSRAASAASRSATRCLS